VIEKKVGCCGECLVLRVRKCVLKDLYSPSGIVGVIKSRTGIADLYRVIQSSSTVLTGVVGEII
jgi:hypothetical protein